MDKSIFVLDKKHNKFKGGTKYFIDCSKINSEPNSIHLETLLKNDRNISIIKAVINFSKHTKINRHIVIKIAHKERTNKKEYQISETLKSINGFIKYICLFDCFDDTYNFIKENDKLPEKICTAKNITDNDNLVLIAPYINSGSIRNHKWNLENINILKSLLKQTLISLMEAYLQFGFLHNDLHLDNILFKKTKLKIIKYDSTEIKTNGYKIIIMDYDSSFIGIDIKNGIEYYWNNIYNLISRIKFDLNKYIMPIKNYEELIIKINKYSINKFDPSKTLELLEIVDNLEFKLAEKLEIPKYNPYVF